MDTDNTLKLAGERYTLAKCKNKEHKHTSPKKGVTLSLHHQPTKKAGSRICIDELKSYGSVPKQKLNKEK